MILKQPSPALITGMRISAGLTQAQAAEMVHLGSFKRWSEYERGVQAIDPARWELFVIKCGEHELYKPAKGVPVPRRDKPVRTIAQAVSDAIASSTPAAPAATPRRKGPGPANRP